MPMDKKWIAIAVGILAAVTAVFALLFFKTNAFAADLGGSCCSDLEERIAELEATTAHKGNRKVTLTVEGQIDAAYEYLSLGDFHKGQISQNGNDESFVGFTGQARISKDLSAGYRLEIDLHQLGLLGLPVDTLQPGVRQSYWFIKSDTLGSVAVGRQGIATNDFDKWSTNKSWLAGKPLSLGSLSDLYLTGIDVPFDGTYRDVLRYDSPVVSGFQLAATWGDSFDIKDANGNGDNYDAALRYAENWKEFSVTAAVGYRRSTDLDVNLLNVIHVSLPTGDVNSYLANGSVMHVPSGIFVNASYANQDWSDLNFKLLGYDVTAGLEEKWSALGKTDVFGSWGRYTVDPDGGSSTDIDYYGLGVVQSIDSAAMDLYLGWRHYQTADIIGDDADTVSAGARIRF